MTTAAFTNSSLNSIKGFQHLRYFHIFQPALIQKAFTEGVHRIFAECDPDNLGSWKLLESLGFTREAHLRKNIYFWKDENDTPIWKDTFIYATLSQGN